MHEQSDINTGNG